MTYTNKLISVRPSIDEDSIRGLLCCAFEGGSNYWIKSAEYHFADGLTLADFGEGGKMQGPTYWHPLQLVPLVPGCSVTIHVKDEPARKVRLTRAKLVKGLDVMARVAPKHFADVIAGRDDADTGDAFLQCCLFGELVYG